MLKNQNVDTCWSNPNIWINFDLKKKQILINEYVEYPAIKLKVKLFNEVHKQVNYFTVKMNQSTSNH